MAKRGANEGSIYKRGDGRWTAALSMPDGKRRYFYGRTRADVARRLRDAIGAVERGLPVAGERMTVGELLARWLEEVARPTVRPRVFDSYRVIAEGHLGRVFGRTRLAKLTPDAIQAYMNSKIADGLSPYTVRNHHAVLRRGLGQAERWGFVHRNVARLVSPPRIIREEVHPLTAQQSRAFLAAVRGHRMEAVFQIAMGLGLRQGEVLGLSWRAVDFDEGLLRVEKNLQRYDGEYHLDEVKTAKSRRTLAIPAPLIETLRIQRHRQLEVRLRAGPDWQGNDWDLVFTTEAGAPIAGASVRRDFKRVLSEAGLPAMRFHDLRHGTASFMLAQGVPLKVVQEVLGHSTIAITADTYSHLTADATREATERVGELLWAGS